MVTDKVYQVRNEPFDRGDSLWIRKILREAEKGDPKVSSFVNETPVIKPSSGSVILYRMRGPQDKRTTRDKYHKFKEVGSKLIDDGRLRKKYYQLHTPSSKARNEKSLPQNFHRHIYSRTTPLTPKHPVIMLHYFGDNTEYKKPPHGNSSRSREFVRADPDFLQDLKKKTTPRDSKPTKVYHESVRDNFKFAAGRKTTESGSGMKNGCGDDSQENNHMNENDNETMGLDPNAKAKGNSDSKEQNQGGAFTARTSEKDKTEGDNDEVQEGSIQGEEKPNPYVNGNEDDDHATPEPSHQGKNCKVDARVDDDENCDTDDGPRDLNQVKNCKKAVTKERKIASCEILSLYEMAKQDIGGFTLSLQLIPSFHAIIAEPKILEVTNKLLQLSHANRALPQLLCYDTTFNLGDFYGSVLVARYVTIQGDPLFPVALMIHDKKTKCVHNDFWRTITTKLEPKYLEDNIPICIDREKAFPAAINGYVQNPVIIYCVNHIKQDIKRWIQACQGREKQDVDLLLEQVDCLLQSESAQHFEKNYSLFSSKWSMDFKLYMDDNIKRDLLVSSKFSISKFSAFDGKEPTNNIGESMNCMIKYYNDWKELPLDLVALKFFQLQCSLLMEFSRNERGYGNRELKEPNMPKFLSKLPEYVTIKEDEFIQHVKDNVTKENNSSEGQLYKDELARRIIDEDLISFAPKLSTFVVRNPITDKVYTVVCDRSMPFPKGLRCNCINPTACLHITAVKLSLCCNTPNPIGKVKLSILKKRGRGHNRKLGRKNPARAEKLLDMTVEADDSILATERTTTANTTEGASHHDSKSPSTLNDEKRSVASPTQTTTTKRTRKGTSKTPASKKRVRFNLRKEKDEEPPNEPTLDIEEEMKESAENPCQNEDCFDPDGIQNARMVSEFHKLLGQHVSFDEATHDRFLKKYPILKCLMGKKWIKDDVLDAIARIIIKEAGFLQIGYVGVAIFAVTAANKNMKSFHHIIHYAADHDLANKTVVLVPTLQSKHWMLGVILLATKEIFILDPFHKEIRNISSCPRADTFTVLLRISAGILASVGRELDDSEWSMHYPIDVPEQDDGHECGVILALLLYTVVYGLPYPSNEDVHCNNKELNREWMFDRFIQHELYREGKLTSSSVDKALLLSGVRSIESVKYVRRPVKFDEASQDHIRKAIFNFPNNIGDPAGDDL